MTYQRKRLKVESVGAEVEILSDSVTTLLMRPSVRHGVYEDLRDIVLSEEEMTVLRDMLNAKLDRIAESRKLAAEMREASERAKRSEDVPEPEQPEGLPEY